MFAEEGRRGIRKPVPIFCASDLLTEVKKAVESRVGGPRAIGEESKGRTRWGRAARSSAGRAWRHSSSASGGCSGRDGRGSSAKRSHDRRE